MDNQTQDIVATSALVQDGIVRLDLMDGSTHAFPVYYYPRLCQASSRELDAVCLRVGGRALRWESLDEDIWIADAISQKYPKQSNKATRQSQSHPSLTISNPREMPLGCFQRVESKPSLIATPSQFL